MSTVLFQQPEAHGLEAEVRSLSEKLDRVVAAVEALDRRREEVEELITDLLPAVNGSLGIAMRRLDELERSGALGVARTAGRALEEAVTAVDPGDLAALGAQAGTGLRALREITAPEVTTMTARALAALRTARKGRPKSLRQLLWAAREPRVRRGLGALLDILKVLGEGVGPSSPVASTPSPPALTGRPVAPVASRAPRAAGTGPGCSAPTGPTPPAREARTLGEVTVSLDAEGFLTDRTAWTPSVAEALAREAGIGPLTDEHWKVLEYCRADAGDSGPAPGMRRITSQLGVPARDLYRLFPGGPGILAARLSGLGKPKSCV